MIKFWNIRSKEVRVAMSEPHITAMWASSDHSPNITQGQDFGWRLAPEIVVEMKQIKQDITILTQIAARLNKPLDEIGEPDILLYVSARYDAENAPVAGEGDYTDEYDAAVRNAEREAGLIPGAAPAHELTIDELEAQLAAKKAERDAAHTTTIETTRLGIPETTTTTTVAPVVTTTTTDAKNVTSTTTKK